jgi:hypothetical protein
VSNLCSINYADKQEVNIEQNGFKMFSESRGDPVFWRESVHWHVLGVFLNVSSETCFQNSQEVFASLKLLRPLDFFCWWLGGDEAWRCHLESRLDRGRAIISPKNIVIFEFHGMLIIQLFSL